MKIYTRTGDRGTTSLVGGTRIAKNDLRLDAYGTVDELNSWIGFIISLGVDDEPTVRFLLSLQNSLFDLGCALATEIDAKWQPKTITATDIEQIEIEIDRMDATLPHHDKFILPGGIPAAAATQIARTVCRRAERLILSLLTSRDEASDTTQRAFPGQDEALQFINRLSDYLFVLARYLNHLASCPETYWQP